MNGLQQGMLRNWAFDPVCDHCHLRAGHYSQDCGKRVIPQVIVPPIYPPWTDSSNPPKGTK